MLTNYCWTTERGDEAKQSFIKNKKGHAKANGSCQENADALSGLKKKRSREVRGNVI